MVSTAFKFSTSPFLDNHFSESIHTMAIGRYSVGLAFIPLHWTPGSMPGDGVRGQNLVHL